MVPAPQSRKLRPRTQRRAGCRRHQKAKPAKPAQGNAANAFLKQQFLPTFDYTLLGRVTPEQIESDFYLSLENLGRLYKFSPYVNTGLIFPLNIRASFEHAHKALNEHHKDTELIIAQTNNGEQSCVTLATLKSINPGWTLYYLPIETLDRLHRQKDKTTFDLVLSVFAYLNLEAGMSLCNENDYHDSCFDSIQQWLIESALEYEDDDLQEHLAECTAFRRKAPILERAIKRPENLELFAERIKTYKPKSRTEKQLKKVVYRLHALYLKYPEKNFYQNIERLEDDDLDEYPISPDEYFSFCWASSGWLFKYLMEYINSDLQEKSCHEAPSTLQYFFSPQKKIMKNLEYETRLLDLICDLAGVLDDL